MILPLTKEEPCAKMQVTGDACSESIRQKSTPVGDMRHREQESIRVGILLLSGVLESPVCMPLSVEPA